MKFINSWPVGLDIGISRSIKVPLDQLLIEPFENESAAKKFWNDQNVALIILTDADDISTFSLLPVQLQSQIKFALAYPEFVTPIGNSHKLWLAITTDDGSGLYLLTSNKCLLLGELDNV